MLGPFKAELLSTFFGLLKTLLPTQDLAKPYDPKKSCWFPLKEGGYAEGIIEATEGDKVSTDFVKCQVTFHQCWPNYDKPFE